MFSKSQYIIGFQCPKALWFGRHRTDLTPPLDPQREALRETGRVVGTLARQCFDSGALVEALDLKGAIAQTKDLIQSGHDTLFEAAAQHPVDGGYAYADILRRGPDGVWDLIEVKGTTSVEPKHIEDVAFQYHAFYGAGYQIGRCFVMHLDKTYVRTGDIDPHALFHLEDVSAKVFAWQAEVETAAGQMDYILERRQEPETAIGIQCFKLDKCSYYAHCWAEMPTYSIYKVFNRNKKKAQELAKLYGLDPKNLPEAKWPTGENKWDVVSYVSGKPHVDSPQIAAFVRELHYPLYFLDYETVSFAVPFFEGTRPFQQIPFQFSLHIQTAPEADLIHHEYLHKERSDPRPALAERLLALCGQEGSVVVYNQSFEKACNTNMAAALPEHARGLEAINARMADVRMPFQKRWLYHPDQRGSDSIKIVLPTFTDLSYQGMTIGDGQEASRRYVAFLEGKTDDIPALWQDLTSYCGQDTLAMKLLLDVLVGYGDG